MNVQFGQLQMDSLDGATVVNRNIEAGRGQARMLIACCSLTMRGSQRIPAPALSQEMLHWGAARLANDAGTGAAWRKSCKVSEREGNHDVSIEAAVMRSSSVRRRCCRINGISGNLRELARTWRP